MMIAPLFPIPMGIFTAKLDFVDFAAGKKLAPHRGIRLATGPLNHPTAPPATASNMPARRWPISPTPSIARAGSTPTCWGWSTAPI